MWMVLFSKVVSVMRNRRLLWIVSWYVQDLQDSRLCACFVKSSYSVTTLQQVVHTLPVQLETVVEQKQLTNTAMLNGRVGEVVWDFATGTVRHQLVHSADGTRSVFAPEHYTYNCKGAVNIVGVHVCADASMSQQSALSSAGVVVGVSVDRGVGYVHETECPISGSFSAGLAGQVENGSPTYWDTEDNDDCAPLSPMNFMSAFDGDS